MHTTKTTQSVSREQVLHVLTEGLDKHLYHQNQDGDVFFLPGEVLMSDVIKLLQKVYDVKTSQRVDDEYDDPDNTLIYTLTLNEQDEVHTLVWELNGLETIVWLGASLETIADFRYKQNSEKL